MLSIGSKQCDIEMMHYQPFISLQTFVVQEPLGITLGLHKIYEDAYESKKRHCLYVHKLMCSLTLQAKQI